MELVLIRGLPGSGKSTMAAVLAQVGYKHFEADQFFTNEEGVYVFDAAQLPKAHQWCLERAKAALLNGDRVVVSNTFTRAWEMQPYFGLANQIGAPIKVVEARGNWKSVHGVPEEAIQRMRDRWEVV